MNAYRSSCIILLSTLSLATACTAGSETSATESTTGVSGPGSATNVPTGGGCDGEACGLVCDESAFDAGEFTISGIAAFDAFFAATLELSGAMRATSDAIQGELAGLFALVGADNGSDFQAALDAKLAFYIVVDDGWTIEAPPVRCEADLAAAATAVAECDADAQPGAIAVACAGACTIDAAAQADCQSDGLLTCRGIAPNLDCGATCQGSCQLDLASACSGTCKGQCDGQAFIGFCQGQCQGECDLGGGGACNGRCAGVCEYEASPGGCNTTDEARCEGSAAAGGACIGACDGKLSVSTVAECEATVAAKVAARVQCYPPRSRSKYTLSDNANSDPSLRAELLAVQSVLQERHARLQAALARAERLIEAAATLGSAGKAAIAGQASALSASSEPKIKVGADCTTATLPAAASLLTDSVAMVTNKIEAAVPVIAALGG